MAGKPTPFPSSLHEHLTIAALVDLVVVSLFSSSLLHTKIRWLGYSATERTQANRVLDSQGVLRQLAYMHHFPSHYCGVPQTFVARVVAGPRTPAYS